MRLIFAALLALPPAARGAPFSGESCRACHSAIRDAPGAPKPQAAQPRGSYDVVVVGGGLAGLTAAHHLKDLKVLLLEKEDRPGGRARRERFDRWAYATGAVYTSKPYGVIRKLYGELGISPSRFKTPVHSYWDKGRIVPEWISAEGLPKLGSSPDAREGLRKLAEKLGEIEESGELTIPIQECDPKALAYYDSLSLHDYLSRNFGPRAAELGDHYARDVFGTGAKEVSAAIGLLYMSSELSPAYAWPGGVGEVAEALAGELGGIVETSALVEEVRPQADMVRVVFRKGERRFEATAKAAILAVPSLVTRRIVRGLSARKERALASVRYSAYAVFSMKFRRPVFRDAFVLWTPGLSFADLTFPGGERLEGEAPAFPGQVAEAYMPLGSSEGRRQLEGQSDEALKKKVLEDLGKVLPGASRELEEMRVVRWGHAMPVLGPGYLSKIQPLLREPEGRIFFAGADTQAPAIEGAIYSGYQAAEEVKRFIERRKEGR